MFKSKLSTLIDEAVQKCIDTGAGIARYEKDGTILAVGAQWAENEKDIEITIFENCVIRFSFTEDAESYLLGI